MLIRGALINCGVDVPWIVKLKRCQDALQIAELECQALAEEARYVRLG
jgi:hypothetical protein